MSGTGMSEEDASTGGEPPGRQSRARFLWKTDGAGRFVEATQQLADVVGAKNADVLGRSVTEIAAAFSLGPEFPAAVASRKSWTLEVLWPLESLKKRAPLTLGAFPQFDEARLFAGFSGYGLFHLDRLVDAQSTGEPAGDAVEETVCDEFFSSAAAENQAPNVVPLRPHLSAAGLTLTERNAFDEIARALGSSTPGAARALLEQVGRAVSNETPAQAAVRLEAAGEQTAAAKLGSQDQSPLGSVGLIDRLPVGVLVARGDEALFANQTLLDYLGYADLAALVADGGLARVFFGRPPYRDNPRQAAFQQVSLEAHDGDAIDADAHLQIVDWDGAGPATLITLRRRRAPPQAIFDSPAVVAMLGAIAQPAALVSRAGRILRVNEAFAVFAATSKESLPGQSILTFVAEESGLTVRDRLARAGDAANHPASILVQSQDHAPTSPARLTLRSLGPGAEGTLCLTLNTQLDHNLEELQAARVEAERVSATKTQFLARVSHEIRTPLSAILGFAEVMLEERFGPIGSERYKEYLKDIHASGQHVLSLVNDLLDLSKIEAGKLVLEFERVEVNAVISECVSLMQPQADNERVVIRLALSQRLPPIRADQRSLKQILLNLLSNAVKFNEAGGQVIVSSALTDAGYVVIRVKDTGIGMTQDEIQMALEPFGQVATSRRLTGTGLGLPLTKALIEANHAAFSIRSRKNEGTLIEVSFAPSQVMAAE
jgi:signal transduction histidine kinase